MTTAELPTDLWDLQWENLRINLNTLSAKALLTHRMIEKLDSSVAPKINALSHPLEIFKEVGRLAKHATDALDAVNVAIWAAIDSTGKSVPQTQRATTLAIENSPPSMIFQKDVQSVSITDLYSTTSTEVSDAGNDMLPPGKDTSVVAFPMSVAAIKLPLEDTNQTSNIQREICERQSSSEIKEAPMHTSTTTALNSGVEDTEKVLIKPSSSFSKRFQQLHETAKMNNNNVDNEFDMLPSKPVPSLPPLVSRQQIDSSLPKTDPLNTKVYPDGDVSQTRSTPSSSTAPRKSLPTSSADNTAQPVTPATSLKSIPQTNQQTDDQSRTDASQLDSSNEGDDVASKSPVDDRFVEGNRPATAYEGRQPPLWCYSTAELTHVDKTTGQLFIVLMEDNHLRKQMWDEVTEAYKCAEKPSDENLCPMNTIVIAPFEGEVYRGVFIRHVDNEHVEVFFLDFGNTSIILKQDLRLVPTNKSTRTALRTCQLAIPCEFEQPQILDDIEANGFDRLLLVLFSGSRKHEDQGNTVTIYTVKDIITEDEPLDFVALPTNRILQRCLDEDMDGDKYRFEVSDATDPHHIWIIEMESISKRQSLESDIHDLPLPTCDPTLKFNQGHCVIYRGQRAIITDISQGQVSLSLLDYGRLIHEIALSDCHRAPLIAYLTPPLAVEISLANCSFDANSWTGMRKLAMRNLLLHNQFRLSFPDVNNLNRLFLINCTTQKNVVKLFVRNKLCSLTKVK